MNDVERKERQSNGENGDHSGVLGPTTQQVALLEDRLAKVTRAFRMLSGYTQTMQGTTDEKTLLQAACKIIVDAGGYRMAWVGYAACDPEKSVIPMASSGIGAECISNTRLSWGDNPLGRGPTGTAIRSGTPVVTRAIEKTPAFLPWREAAGNFGYASAIALPLVCDDTIIGALNVYSSDPHAFDQDEISLLTEVAANMSFGIIAIRMREERRRAQEELYKSWQTLRITLNGVVKAMATVTELRDPYTAGHQERVGQLAEAIASELGLPKSFVEGVGIAARMHDLGKVYVPIQILSKPSLLTSVEYSLVKVHSEAGYEVLKNIEFPWPVAQAVLQHHERADGSGYPMGLKREDTLLHARIIAVADTVEAMSNARPYRPAPGLDAALEEISTQAGTLYDREAAEACIRLFNEKGFRFS